MIKFNNINSLDDYEIAPEKIKISFLANLANANDNMDKFNISSAPHSDEPPISQKVKYKMSDDLIKLDESINDNDIYIEEKSFTVSKELKTTNDIPNTAINEGNPRIGADLVKQRSRKEEKSSVSADMREIQIKKTKNSGTIAYNNILNKANDTSSKIFTSRCKIIDAMRNPNKPEDNKQNDTEKKYITGKSIDFSSFPIFQSKGFNQLEYTIEENERRYNMMSITVGKDLFKNRYISENIIEQNKNRPKKSSKEITKVVSPKYEMKELCSKRQKTNEITQRKSVMVNYTPDDRNVIKYNSLFIQKIQKAILLFNFKKYDQSFIYLKENKIAKNEEEFGEILLVITGFDKNEIGAFLSKPKLPNKDYIILKSFVKKMNFVDLDFTKAFRFLLSHINLPKDSGQMLQVVEVFSEVYFIDNQDSGQFLDINSVYLLSSTVLAINTMFNRRDISKINVISMESFVKMNSTTDKKLCEQVYNEIKNNKLDFIYDYNEIFNKRLGIKIDLNNDGILLTHSSHCKETEIENENVLDLNGVKISEMEGEELLKLLKHGDIFTKFGHYGDSHQRFVSLSSNESQVTWKPLSLCSKIFGRSKSIQVADIIDVYIGASHSKIFERYNIPPEFDRFCFSIESSKRTLDLRKDDDHVCKKWYHAIKYLIHKTKGKLSLNHASSLSCSIYDTVSNIWKNEILPKWQTYRTFVKLKHQFFASKDFFGNKKSIKEKLKYPTNTQGKLLNEKDKNDFVYLYTHFGIPSWLRKKVWQVLIGNDMKITENLFNKFLGMSENVNFVINHKTEQVEAFLFPENSHYHNLQIDELGKSNEMLVTEILKDINKIYMKFKLQIKDSNYDELQFKDHLYKIIRVFTIARPDVVYSKHLVYFGTIFLLNSDNYYIAYVHLINFVCSKAECVLKFLSKDEIFIKTRYDFFQKLFKNSLPKLYQHFNSFDISMNLFFYNWFEYVYIKCFFQRFHHYLKILDLFLIKGEVLLYELGIAIMKSQQRHFLNSSVKEILKDLKSFPYDKVNEEEFTSTFEEISIRDSYARLIQENDLANEKGLLFESMLNNSN